MTGNKGRKKLCFECCIEQEVEIGTQTRTHMLNDKEITYQAEVYICKVCGVDIPDNDLYARNLRSAYLAAGIIK